jgi:hypothetical protein
MEKLPFAALMRERERERGRERERERERETLNPLSCEGFPLK